MGDNFLKWQQANFQKGRDLAVASSERPKLFVRPDVLETIYSSSPCPSESYQEGEQLVAMVKAGGDKVPLLRGHRCVGYIEGEAAATFLQNLPKLGVPNMVPVQIQGVAE